ncbi:MAG: ATP-binding protein [Tabrizicola sp.]|nr:ATP-binding protein [Tabrizicola sp.]
MIDSNFLAVRQGLQMLCEAPPLADLAEDPRGTAELVLAEVLNNLVEHGYRTEKGEIDITLRMSGARIDCAILDSGLPMPDGQPPAGSLPACADVPVDALPEGGFGWHLIRTLTDDLAYRRTGAQNRLTFSLPALC